jgi:hypothetical protein
MKRFAVLVLHRRAGKTQLALMQLIDRALQCTAELANYVYLAPFLKQAKAIAWTRLKKVVEPLVLLNAAEVNEGELFVRLLHNGAVIRLYGGDNPDAMRGMRLDGIVIDEVAQIKPEVWNEIVQPALADRLGWAVFIGTPHGINLFSELYFAASSRPEWFVRSWTVYQTDTLDPKEVERQRAEMPENGFRREYLCDFAAAGDDQLLSLTDVEEAARRIYTDRDVFAQAVILGVDPARFGDDRSVIVRRQGLQMFKPQVYRGIDNMDLAGRVAAAIEEHKPHAVFVDSGAGAGVIDRLRQLGYSIVVEVPFGGKAVLDRQYVNRRTEMWFAMRDWIMAGGSIPNDQALKLELATPIYWFDPAGKKALESKDDIKKRLLDAASPDIADALALTFAAPVHAPTELEQFRRQHRKKRRDEGDYGHNPYG